MTKEVHEIDINGVNLPVKVFVSVEDGTDYDALAKSLVEAGTVSEAESAVEVLQMLCTMSEEEENGLEFLVSKMTKLLEERKFMEAWCEAEEAAKAAESEVPRGLNIRTVLAVVGMAALAAFGVVLLRGRDKGELVGDTIVETGNVLRRWYT